MAQVQSPIWRPLDALRPVIESYTPYTQAKYLLSSVNPPKVLTLPNGGLVPYYDYHSIVFMRLLMGISKTIPHIVKDVDTLPLVSWDYYQTTSLYWLIGMYNGVSHGLEIRSGDRWEIPSLGDVDAVLEDLAEEQAKSTKREVVL